MKELSPLQQQQEKISASRKELEKEVGCIFDNPQELDSRIEKFILELDSYEKAGLMFDKEKMIQGVKESVNIKNKEAFTAHLLKVLEPLVILKITHANIFEKISREVESREVESREVELSTDGNSPLSEVLYAGLGEDPEGIYIHLSDAKDLIKEKGLGNFKKEIRNGLVELAKILKSHPNVKYIYAISWIVAKNPRLLEKLGFTIKGAISEEERIRNFSEDEKPVAKALMTREDFLAKYDN